MQALSKIFPFVALLVLGSGATAQTSMAPSNSVLWFDKPAKPGMTEALPVGNGRIGALVYGGETERIVLNDSSLWTGDENPSGDYKSMGSYQMLGELLLTPNGSPAAAAKVSAPSGQKAFFPTQEVSAASDGDPKTKWCVEHGGKQVVWQVEMPAGAPAATWYSFTSAEDVPARDPQTWELAGSDDGEKWTALDQRENQPSLATRGASEHFNFANKTAFHFYRFTFQPNLDVPHFQVAEIGLQGLQTESVPQDFRRALDISTATASTTYTRNGVHFRREVFASEPADVIAVRWSADKPGAINGTIELKGAHGETTLAKDMGLSYQGQFANGLRYLTQTRVLHRGGTAVITDGKVQLKGCYEAVILVAAGTNYIHDYAKNYCGPDPAPRIANQLEAASGKSFDSLKTAQVAQFQKVLNRTSLDLGTSPAERVALPTDQRRMEQSEKGGDPDFEELQFQYGRYLLISCSRPDGVPANLQGLWNDSNNPPWYADYHTNINIQMNYWPAEVTNLSEYQTPLFDLVKSQIPAWRKETALAQDWKTPSGELTTRGFAVRTSHNITGGMGWEWDNTANAWYCQHFWEHYAFTGDKQYLREVAYPVIKETVQFWEDHLKTLPDGRLAVPHGWSPEHGPREDGVSYNQEIVWDLFNNFVQASRALNIDPEYRAKVTAMRDKLVGPKIGKWNQLQEWMTDRDDPLDQHRHTSHLFGVFPGREIGVTKTPELAKAAKSSLDARTNAPGGDVNEWACVWRAAIYARLHDGEQAHTLLRRFAGLTCPNLFGLLPGTPQIDGAFGYTAAVAEMLLQSQENEINLLPALPSEWANGSVSGLKARGGVTVAMKWAGGQLQSATLLSATAQTVTVRLGQIAKKVNLPAGKVVVLQANVFEG